MSSGMTMSGLTSGGLEATRRMRQSVVELERVEGAESAEDQDDRGGTETEEHADGSFAPHYTEVSDVMTRIAPVAQNSLICVHCTIRTRLHFIKLVTV